MAAAGGAAVTVAAAGAALPGTALAADFVPYSREAFDAALASGRPVLLDTYASW